MLFLITLTIHKHEENLVILDFGHRTIHLIPKDYSLSLVKMLSILFRLLQVNFSNLPKASEMKRKLSQQGDSIASKDREIERLQKLLQEKTPFSSLTTSTSVSATTSQQLSPAETEAMEVLNQLDVKPTPTKVKELVPINL